MKKLTKLLFLILFLAHTVTVGAQERKFDPEGFKMEMHKYIAEKAQLTADEQAAFFPLYDEMKEKERALFSSQRNIGKKPQTDADFVEAIKNYDKIDVEVKKLQQSYHLKFLKVLPAKKVFRVIKAEDMFRIHMFQKMGRPKGNPPHQAPRRQK